MRNLKFSKKHNVRNPKPAGQKLPKVAKPAPVKAAPVKAAPAKAVPETKAATAKPQKKYLDFEVLLKDTAFSYHIFSNMQMKIHFY